MSTAQKLKEINWVVQRFAIPITLLSLFHSINIKYDHRVLTLGAVVLCLLYLHRISKGKNSSVGSPFTDLDDLFLSGENILMVGFVISISEVLSLPGLPFLMAPVAMLFSVTLSTLLTVFKIL